MTKVEKLEGNKTSTGKRGGNNKTSPPTTTGANNSCINPERMKKAGPKKMIDGRTQFWCTQHVCPKGRYNGLYCNHDDAGHPGWQIKKDAYKANKKQNKTPGATSVGTKTEDNKSKTNGCSFKLTDKLKKDLCTQGQMTAEQVEEILGTDFS